MLIEVFMDKMISCQEFALKQSMFLLPLKGKGLVTGETR